MVRDPRNVFSSFAVSPREECKDVEVDRSIAKGFLAASSEDVQSLGPKGSQVVSGLQSLAYTSHPGSHHTWCFSETSLGGWAQSWGSPRGLLCSITVLPKGPSGPGNVFSSSVQHLLLGEIVRSTGICEFWDF